jgi:dihydrolipoamide dehydrogenase
MSNRSADVVILGGGSGGYAAAIRSAELGRSVILIEENELGGTCLHQGCIPTKALLHAAEVADSARTAAQFGVDVTFEGVELEKVLSYKNTIITRLHKGLQGLVDSYGITVVNGRGRLSGPNGVEVDGELITGAAVILAPGSYPKTLPGIGIGGRVVTSDQAVVLPSVPKKAIILGGGVSKMFGKRTNVGGNVGRAVSSMAAAVQKDHRMAPRRPRCNGPESSGCRRSDR